MLGSQHGFTGHWWSLRSSLQRGHQQYLRLVSWSWSLYIAIENLRLDEVGWRVNRNFHHYFCNISVTLNYSTMKEFFKKYFKQIPFSSTSHSCWCQWASRWTAGRTVAITWVHQRRQEPLRQRPGEARWPVGHGLSSQACASLPGCPEPGRQKSFSWKPGLASVLRRLGRGLHHRTASKHWTHPSKERRTCAWSLCWPGFSFGCCRSRGNGGVLISQKMIH